MIDAVIFDMDGLLIDSEPLWEKAEVEIFNSVGFPLASEMTNQTMGLRVDEVVSYWFERHPWEKSAKSEVADRIVNRVIELIKEKGRVKSGAKDIIKLFSAIHLPIAIASSSPSTIIEAVIGKLDISNFIKLVYSAENEEYGKPHPAVYLSTAKKLGVQPENCLAFEDSPNGVISAKAAKMKCVAVPDPKVKDSKIFQIADLRLDSLEQFTPEYLNTF